MNCTPGRMKMVDFSPRLVQRSRILGAESLSVRPGHLQAPATVAPDFREARKSEFDSKVSLPAPHPQEREVNGSRYLRCAGLDVHRKLSSPVLLLQTYKGWRKIQTFTTMTADLLKLSDWLLTRDCTHVAMESTGEYWKPVFNILAANFEVMLVMRNISKPYQDGRQT